MRRNGLGYASTIILKEVKFRPKTDDHDFDFKVRHIRRFLGEGNKAKLVIVFRGREIVHPETGQALLKRFRDRLELIKREANAGEAAVVHWGDKPARWDRI